MASYTATWVGVDKRWQGDHLRFDSKATSVPTLPTRADQARFETFKDTARAQLDGKAYQIGNITITVTNDTPAYTIVQTP